MLEFNLTGRKKRVPPATRLFGFDYSRLLNSRDAKYQLTVPATAKNTPMTVPLAGYTSMSSGPVLWDSVKGLALTGQDLTIEHWALMPASVGIRLMVTWVFDGSMNLYYINGVYDNIDGTYWGIALIANRWYAYDMDTAAINDGQWHHFAITYTHEEGVVRARLYIDGVLRRLRIRGTATPFDLEYAQSDPAVLKGVTAEFQSPSGQIPVAEFVVWEGVPGHIGKGKPTSGPIRDTTQPQGQLYVTGNSTRMVVPAGVYTLFVDGIGGGSGGTKTASGGAARVVSATLAVVPGDTLIINPGTGGGGGNNGTASTITVNGVLKFTAPGGVINGTGGGDALYPGGPSLGTAGRAGGTAGYSGAGGGVRILWGEGRPLPVRSAPDV